MTEIVSSGCFDDDHEHLEHRNSQFNYKYSHPMMTYTGSLLSGQVSYDSASDLFTVTGQFSGLTSKPLKYWAANPIVRNYSYPGSGLPFPNPEVAYENTPNQGDLDLDNQGQFSFTLDHPNAYYLRQGKILMKPHVHLTVPGHSEVLTIAIGDDFPNRSLSSLPDRPNRTIGR